ncbi:MAG: GNAT family N-acetyltransferase [Chloroflexi bacterium]|nr:GNAT family N-acetyltransferase [Chloroflexota bacterium]
MIRILQPGDELLLEAFLRPQIESSMFLVGNMRAAGLVDNGRSFEGTYAAAFEQDRMVGVAALYWNGSLILQSPVAYLDGLYRTAVNTAKRPITRIIGPQQQVQAVLDSVSLAAAVIKLDEPEKLYRLRLPDLQTPLKLHSGAWQGRRVQAGDVELMTRWRVGYALEIMGETESPKLWRQMRSGVEKYMRLGHSWILEDEGQPVATSSFNTTTTELVQVGGVWTLPALRSRGYGRAAVAASLLAVQAEGIHSAILFTGEDNIPAQKAYEALGFRHIGDYRITLLKEPLSPIV